MRHLVGTLHINKLLSTDESCILTILINFFGDQQWKSYPPDNSDIIFSKKIFAPSKVVKEKINYLLKKIKTPSVSTKNKQYSRMDPKLEIAESEASLNHVVHCLYIAVDAYLNAYDIKSVRETWSTLNEELLNDSKESNTETILSPHSNYYVTDTLIKKYSHILKSVKELENLFIELKNGEDLPEMLEYFENIKSIFTMF